MDDLREVEKPTDTWDTEVVVDHQHTQSSDPVAEEHKQVGVAEEHKQFAVAEEHKQFAVAEEHKQVAVAE